MISGWMGKDVAHIRWNNSCKKELSNAICSNMDGHRDYHTKWNKSERQMSYDITYMFNLKTGHKWTYLWSRNRFTDIKSKGEKWGGYKLRVWD